MVESLDDGVGRVVEKLDDLKLTERTIVIFTSDNGGLATLEGPEHARRPSTPRCARARATSTRAASACRCIVNGPARSSRAASATSGRAASTSSRPSWTLCGVHERPRADGRREPRCRCSRAAKALRPRRALLALPALRNQGGKPGGAIRAGDYKLIEFYEDGRRELFDLKTRPRREPQPDCREAGVVRASWPASSTRGARQSARRCRRPTPTTCPTRQASGRHDHPARSDGRRARRHAALRAAAAQEHARLLGPRTTGRAWTSPSRSPARSRWRCCKAAATARAAAKSR